MNKYPFYLVILLSCFSSNVLLCAYQEDRPRREHEEALPRFHDYFRQNRQEGLPRYYDDCTNLGIQKGIERGVELMVASYIVKMGETAASLVGKAAQGTVFAIAKTAKGAGSLLGKTAKGTKFLLQQTANEGPRLLGSTANGAVHLLKRNETFNNVYNKTANGSMHLYERYLLMNKMAQGTASVVGSTAKGAAHLFKRYLLDPLNAPAKEAAKPAEQKPTAESFLAFLDIEKAQAEIGKIKAEENQANVSATTKIIKQCQQLENLKNSTKNSALKEHCAKLQKSCLDQLDEIEKNHKKTKASQASEAA